MDQPNSYTDEEVLWLIFGAPDDELLPSAGGDPKDFYPVDPRQLPHELGGKTTSSVEL